MGVDFKKGDNTLLVMIDGDIDAESAEGLRRRIDMEYECNVVRDMVFDFSHVDFMDSTGVGMIIGRYKRVKALGGSVSVVGARRNVKRIIELSGLGRIVSVR